MKEIPGWAWIVIGIVGISILGGGGYMAYNAYKQRGIRNNNPGNLRITNIAWQGKVPVALNTDGSFEQFADSGGIPGHLWGIRALYKDVWGDIIKDGLDTVDKLIRSYAPPTENDTVAYINAVAKEVGKNPYMVLSATDMPALIKAIIRHENGIQPYPDADILKAIRMA